MFKKLCLFLTHYIKKLLNYKGNYEDGLYHDTDSCDETELTSFMNEHTENVIHPYKEEACVIFHNNFKYNRLATSSPPESPVGSPSNSPIPENEGNENTDIFPVNFPSNNDQEDIQDVEHENIQLDISKKPSTKPPDFLSSNLVEMLPDNKSNDDNDNDNDDNTSNGSSDIFQDSLEI